MVYVLKPKNCLSLAGISKLDLLNSSLHNASSQLPIPCPILYHINPTTFDWIVFELPMHAR